MDKHPHEYVARHLAGRSGNSGTGDDVGNGNKALWDMKSPVRDEPMGEEEKEREDGDEGEFFPQPRRLPSMIPARYKLKEERRKVLKISASKLKKIEDPESWLCRSVLINNTMKRLQREVREEKLQKQMSLYNNKDCLLDYQLNNNHPKDIDNCVYDKPTKPRKVNKLESSITTNGVSLNEDVVEKIPSIKRCASRKRSVDEDCRPPLQEEDPSPPTDDMDDCDVHDVLSQLYMPPTPRLITSIDSDTDDDDLNVVDMDSSFIEEPPKVQAVDDAQPVPPPNKKPKLDVFPYPEDFLCSDPVKEQNRTCSLPSVGSGVGGRDEDEEIELEDEEDIKRRLSHSLSNQLNFRKNDAFFDDATTGLDACDGLYSCGHASLFGDLQTVTFHNLIASLET